MLKICGGGGGRGGVQSSQRGIGLGGSVHSQKSSDLFNFSTFRRLKHL